MMKKVSKFAALAVSALAIIGQPALASNLKSESNSSAAAAASTTSAGSSQRGAKKVYCTMTESTGTRIPRKVCLTERQWQDEGVNVRK